MPEGAARLAIGDDGQADLFLALDETRNLGILDFAQLLGRDAGGAGLGDRFGAKKAAHVVGAEGRHLRSGLSHVRLF
ncbi:hypothetical protein [Palleronia marisminoris]|uniref:hypothetical protein n=1 Tax=Palleronia marisminoris TaxID=315423 RepID=UPI001FDF1165|nr:hypothetical protein [Palleronia marisminoris]